MKDRISIRSSGWSDGYSCLTVPVSGGRFEAAELVVCSS